jgi:Txe/YoeB family toxin of Txe-Axe toxin-antitoxin module
VNNSIIKDLNDSEEEEISNNQLKKKITRMINEIKEEMYKQLNKFKEDTNKQ